MCVELIVRVSEIVRGAGRGAPEGEALPVRAMRDSPPVLAHTIADGGDCKQNGHKDVAGKRAKCAYGRQPHYGSHDQIAQRAIAILFERRHQIGDSIVHGTALAAHGHLQQEQNQTKEECNQREQDLQYINGEESGDAADEQDCVGASWESVLGN